MVNNIIYIFCFYLKTYPKSVVSYLNLTNDDIFKNLIISVYVYNIAYNCDKKKNDLKIILKYTNENYF